VKAYLVDAREIAPNTRHFVFESPEWSASFVPGQFVSLTRKIGENEITRAYSIASPPDGRRFSLCANLVQEGHFSPFLFSLERGGEIDFKGPYGAFIPRRPLSDSIFVATGTGIAPFRSMLHSDLLETTDRHFTLIFGVRRAQGLLYNEELKRLAERHRNFTYLPTLTQPAGGWKGLTGRVQPHALKSLGERRDMDVCLCGLREMVDEMRAQLKEAGLDRRRTIYEKYD
jgi:ferredoxin-NADP reductase